ncbi:MAG: hypothetical protein KDA37_18730, partial [Planctomycetales bacterium]|nr:hypothetical protein [Planctomycetales bacterium]
PLEAAIAIDPDHPDASRQLEALYGRRRAFRPLYALLERKAERAEDDAARAATWLEMAKLASKRLHDAPKALALYRSIVALADAPGQGEPVPAGISAEALESLERLGEREQDWESLAHALERRAAEANDPIERAGLLSRLGDIQVDHLKDPAAASRTLRARLELAPDDAAAATALREALIEAGDAGGIDALYASGADPEGHAAALEAAFAHADGAEGRADIATRLGALCEDALADPRRAIVAYERARQAKPADPATLDALARVYERAERWDDLADTLDALANDPERDDDARGAALDRVREVALTRLHDAPRAFDAAAAAYRLDPSNPARREGLEAAAAAAGAHEALVALYQARLDDLAETEVPRDTIPDGSGPPKADRDERVAGVGPEVEEPLLLRRRIAAVTAEHLGRPAEAITALEGALRTAPDDARTITLLDGLYRATGQTEGLRALYDHRIERAPTTADARALRFEVAQLEEDVLGDDEAAAARFRAVLEEAPADPEALAALDRLDARLGRWDELEAVLRRRLEAAQTETPDDTDPSEDPRLTLGVRLGGVCHEHLGRPDEAIEQYDAALAIDPVNEGAIAGLEAVAAGEPAPDSARALRVGRSLEPAYERLRAYAPLADVWARRLA